MNLIKHYSVGAVTADFNHGPSHSLEMHRAASSALVSAWRKAHLEIAQIVCVPPPNICVVQWDDFRNVIMRHNITIIIETLSARVGLILLLLSSAQTRREKNAYLSDEYLSK